MTIKWTPECRIDRKWLYEWHDQCPELDTLANALDVAVAALQVIAKADHAYRDGAEHYAQETLRQIGVDDDAR